MKYYKWLWIVTPMAVLSLVFAYGEALSQTPSCPFWGMGPGMMGGTWGWIGGIFMILFWVLVLVALVLFIRWLAGSGRMSSGAQPPAAFESPLEILKKRYASGEINQEQYQSMKNDLQ
ncbi:SHOCT domain-containing protein [Desulfoferrobacter suflitae]|uniref:SHOCT domain-containing protein n=1 Tax=Desulfoferrobacter suflitae TaxID=2865782 RepID=UPI0021642538|nr:SHOCT domain-containing protein [Desulfoferrobacter suflitae]MCK8604207.1 SHOCT domain-containing protein [Desulfoferrobacter suflitae]